MDGDQVERGQRQSEARAVGPFDQKTTTGSEQGPRRWTMLGERSLGRQSEERVLGQIPYAGGLFSLLRIEFQDATDKRRRIAACHFCGGLAKLVGDRLARVSTGCAPSLQVVFKFEQVCGNS